MTEIVISSADERRDTGNKTFASRRTFAIISHPDAGKTTLTEKLILNAGAIRDAGKVKAKQGGRGTRSDWMEIEQKRGISVSSSVISFEHEGLTFNLLDTPGHADFSEDTYRTLTAVDAAIMVLDAAKGIESQTLKLFEVCRLRDIPILTFVNKIDREGLEPLEILDEIAETLALDVCPVMWPAGMGVDCKGSFDLVGRKLVLPDGQPGDLTWDDFDDLVQDERLAADRVFGPALETASLAVHSLPAFDQLAFSQGHLTPVFFGSALKEMGVAELLHAIAAWAPPPRPQPAIPAPIAPDADKVSGFIFKVQANMDPNHRDRIAFMRVSSGTFKRGMKLRNERSGRDLAISNPVFFFAQDRELAEEAVAGDVVGIPNHGTLSVGDTLSEGGGIQVTGIPNFAPEIIRRVRLSDPLKSKQLGKALADLSEEGVTQVFRPLFGADWIIGVVGALQLEVLAARVEKEYGVPIRFEAAGYETARWVSAADPKEFNRFTETNRSAVAVDSFARHVILIRNEWERGRYEQDWPGIKFHKSRERV